MLEYYKMYPTMFTKNYYFNNQFEKDLLTNKYSRLCDAIEYAKQTKICLREQNWYVYEYCLGGLLKRRLTLKSLFDMGLLSKVVEQDSISVYYNWA